jgi:putative tryptophan/tyrosine transport system substrate-binding protein
MPFDQLKRREFIMLLGGAAASWPLAASAQQEGRVRRIGVLYTQAEGDPQGQIRLTAFRDELQKMGWIEGRNVRFDIRWGAADTRRIRGLVAELVALAPDVILAVSAPVVVEFQQASPATPIVFVGVADPVAAGIVASLAQPDGNATGFLLFEFSLSPKWLELLKEIAPSVTRVAVIRDAAVASGIAQLAAIQSVAPSFGVELRAVDVRDISEMERTLAAVARGPNNGLIVPASAIAMSHRDVIIRLAAQYRLPAVYTDRADVTSGGLVSYGPERVDPYRRAAGYIDRILKGEKPADLPVQAPTKYELVINMKTARALGIEVPPTLLARADEVIE